LYYPNILHSHQNTPCHIFESAIAPSESFPIEHIYEKKYWKAILLSLSV
jgi:hypothetical protein